MFNKRTFLLLFLLLIAIGTASSVCAADLSDDAVDSSLDEIEVNDNNELMAVGKLSAPWKKSFDDEMLIKCKIDF